MTSRTGMPRFLLPSRSPLWRGTRVPLASSRGQLVRFASTKGGSGKSGAGSKPIVLEKPAKFNPPSHGSRLKKNTMPRHYGASLTAEEVAAQKQRSYPGMMAPEGTWAHFFWHSRMLHVFITMGTLMSLGIFTFFMNYATNSPFKDLIPPISYLWSHPFDFLAAWKNVIILHEQDKGRRAYESRIAQQNDAAKRRYYMKMHGIEAKNPVTLVFGKGEEPSEEVLEAEAMGREPPARKEEDSAPTGRKKMFGIF